MNRKGITAKTLIVSSLFLFMSSGLFAIDYEIFGRVSVSGTMNYQDWTDKEKAADPEKKRYNLSAAAAADLNHRISFDIGSLYAHHSLELNTAPVLVPSLFELYATINPVSWLNITIGRQRLHWGNGYMFTPTDSFHPVRTDAKPEQSNLFGFTGFGFTFYPVTDLSLTAALSLDEAFTNKDDTFWQDFRPAVYVSYMYAIVDFYVSAVYQYEETFRPGTGISIDLYGVIISSEFGVEFYNQTAYPSVTNTPPYCAFEKNDPFDPAFFADLSVEKTFYMGDVSFSLLIEYLYNGCGYTKAEYDTLFDCMDMAESAGISIMPESGETTNGADFPAMLGRHYIAAGITLGYSDIFSTDHSILFNASDASFQMNHGVLFAAGELEFGVSGWWRYGKERSEFGLPPTTYGLSFATTYNF